MFLLNYRWNYYSLLEPIKECHEEISIHTPSSQTMGNKELEPWSPRWVRQELRKRNSGLLPNDPNHDEKPSANAKGPLCKCDLECQSHMTIDYDTYGMRYWSCPQPTCLFHWGWDEEKPWEVVSVWTFTWPIVTNVVINHFIFLKGVRVDLFPPPPNPLGCDFKQWIDDYMTPTDEEYVGCVKKNGAMRKGVSSSKESYLLCFVLLFHYGVVRFS
jgi:hypothetical protein